MSENDKDNDDVIRRVWLPLTGLEERLLLRMAEEDIRGMKDQMRYLIRQEAIRRGWLEPLQEA